MTKVWVVTDDYNLDASGGSVFAHREGLTEDEVLNFFFVDRGVDPSDRKHYSASLSDLEEVPLV